MMSDCGRRELWGKVAALVAAGFGGSCEAAFRRYARGPDGTLGPDELVTLLSDAGVGTAGNRLTWAAAVIVELDDGDERIGWAEFAAHVPDRAAVVPAAVAGGRARRPSAPPARTAVVSSGSTPRLGDPVARGRPGAGDVPLAFYPLCRRCDRAVEVPNPGLALHPPSFDPAAAASRTRVRYSGHQAS
jgi:hypothetical protein